MKMLFALSMAFVCSIASAQGKYRMGEYPVDKNPADYTIKVHISSTHFRTCPWPGDLKCTDHYADAVVSGTKVEISGGVNENQARLLIPGAYLAKLTRKPHVAGGQPVIGQWYILLLPGMNAWGCTVSGLSE
jgi:hypothetical protein